MSGCPEVGQRLVEPPLVGDGRGRAGGEVSAVGWRQNGKSGRSRVQKLIRGWKRRKLKGKVTGKVAGSEKKHRGRLTWQGRVE